MKKRMQEAPPNRGEPEDSQGSIRLRIVDVWGVANRHPRLLILRQSTDMKRPRVTTQPEEEEEENLLRLLHPLNRVCRTAAQLGRRTFQLGGGV